MKCQQFKKVTVITDPNNPEMDLIYQAHSYGKIVHKSECEDGFVFLIELSDKEEISIQPSENNRETLDPDEFKEYLLSFQIMGAPDNPKLLDYIKYQKEKSENIHKTIRKILSILPHQYYYAASQTFYEMLENGEI